ncbi:MAG TPA: DUF2304 domain-containing protein [Tepidisphaeraceae bacterium]|jgi:hypothetical protein|nr:DUF2304 domain-containing protein [Tepidisphaeraceae bacterium]
MFKTLIPLVFGLSLLLLAVRRLSQYRLKERYTLLFFFIAAPLLGLACWPDAVAYIAHGMHIEYGTVALLGVTALFSILILELLSIVSVQDRKINTLAQLVGILLERQQHTGQPLDPSLPTEDELRAMLTGRPGTSRLRNAFKSTKPVMMTLTDQPPHKDRPTLDRE